MLIRPATKSDLPDVMRLYFDLNKAIRQNYDRSMSPTYPRSTFVKHKIRAAIHERQSLLLVAEVKGKIVGFLRADAYLAPIYRTRMILAEVHAVYTQPKYRGQKIGTELLKIFITWAKKKKAKRIRIATDFSNARAQSLYRRMGWKNYVSILEGDLK